MKRIASIAVLMIIGLFTVSLVSAQEKKDEKKVKIIIADKSGTRVITDTTLAEDLKNDTLILNGGKVIYITKKSSGDMRDKEVRVIARSGKDGENSSANYVIVSNGNSVRSLGENEFDVLVDDHMTRNDTDQTKYIIAKNGITVSIEGKDDEKVKEIAAEIEKIIGERKEGSDQVRKKN